MVLRRTMRAVIQRCLYAKLKISGKIYSQIENGLVVFLGVGTLDTESDAEKLAYKISNIRIFEDANGKINLSPKDVGASILVVSNFTLYGNMQRGFRPDFLSAKKGEEAKKLYDYFVEKIKSYNTFKTAQTGVFGEDMKIEVENDGPINIILNSEDLK